MNSENIKNNDPLQLQQMIIFLKAELAKYKKEVEKYKDGFHYSLAENLEQENLQLMNEKNKLTDEITKLNKELETKKSDGKEVRQLDGTQNEEDLSFVVELRKDKNDLRPLKQQLKTVITKLDEGLNVNQTRDKEQVKQVSLLHNKLADSNTTMERLEHKLVELIQETNKHVYSQTNTIELASQERAESKKMQQYLLGEIDEKNNIIEKLQREIVEKNANATSIGAYAPIRKPTIEEETLIQLDDQIKKVLAQSLDYEEKLDAKLLVLHALEEKLNWLTVEIDNVKVLGIEGRILKKF